MLKDIMKDKNKVLINIHTLHYTAKTTKKCSCFSFTRNTTQVTAAVVPSNTERKLRLQTDFTFKEMHRYT